jgi:FixJ family two-component response regulator
MVQVFLVDDDATVRKSLARALREEGFGVEEFESAEAFLARSEPPRHGPTKSKVLIDAGHAVIEQVAADREACAELAVQRQRYSRLTLREREVLRGVVNGRLNKQIAGDLGLVEQTIKWHRAHIMERMHVRTVAELMYVAARLGVGARSAQTQANRPISLNQSSAFEPPGARQESIDDIFESKSMTHLHDTRATSPQ